MQQEENGQAGLVAGGAFAPYERLTVGNISADCAPQGVSERNRPQGGS